MKNLQHLFFLFFAAFLFGQKPEKVTNIEGVVLNKTKTKFKNKQENPAYAIMQEVWKRKRNNGLDKFDNYKFKEYEKIEIDIANIDSSFMKKRLFRKVDFIFDYADSAENGKLALPVYINESIYQNLGKNRPDQRKKRLLTAQKSSGFENNEIISLSAKNLYRDINIYENTINYFDIGFMSPVSKEGFSVYDYNLLEETTLNGQEVYKIFYQPRRKDVLAFEGYLYISKDYYAVVQASLRSTKKMSVNFVNGITTQLVYDNPNDSTFLPKSIRTKLDISPFSKSKDAKAMIAKRWVDFSDYEFNTPIANSDFDTKSAEMESGFVKKDDEFWQRERTDSLSQEEKGVYEMLEKLDNTPRFKRIVKTFETFSSGYYNVGHAIDIGNIYSVYGRNAVEGDRIRLGARTYFSQNDTWRIEGYGAYGFKDQQFKYGAEGRFMFNKVNRFTIGAGTRRDILQLGVRLTGSDGIMSRSFASSSVFGRGENASVSSVNQANVFSSIEPIKNIQLRMDASWQTIKSANPEHFNLSYYDNKTGQLRQTLNDTHATLSIIARPGAKYSQTGVDRYEHSTLAPTIVLKYTRGLEGVFNADFGYDKLQFMFYKPFLIGNWGKLFTSFEAGKNFDTVPLALQNVIPGNQSYSIAQNTFSQLNYYEFVADTYSTLHLEHHFNGKIFSYIPLIKKLKLREVAFFHAAYGSLSDASKNINVEGWRYSAPSDRVYYEYGVGIENIGFGNLRIFRIDFNWRGNYLDRPNASRFGIKTGFQFYF